MAARRGYQVNRPETRTEPPAVAVGGPDIEPIASDQGDPLSEFALEPVLSPDPTMVLSRHWSNRAEDRMTAFVAPTTSVATAVEDLLRPPVGVVREGSDGCRTFFNGPDRVPLDGGGYAALDRVSDIVWREVPGDEPRARVSTDRTRLELVADSTPRIELDGVDALKCPPSFRFPYQYQRLDDKRFHVVDAAGREVGTFASVAALKTRFTPVPMPLVPDHLFDGSIAGTWTVIDAAEADRSSV